jgi:hypothetical protein
MLDSMVSSYPIIDKLRSKRNGRIASGSGFPSRSQTVTHKFPTDNSPVIVRAIAITASTDLPHRSFFQPQASAQSTGERGLRIDSKDITHG